MRLGLPLIAAALLFTPSAQAFDRNFSLTPGQEARLSPAARALYLEAQEQADRINFDEAIRLLAQASEIDASLDGLNFLVANLAKDRAALYFSRNTTFVEPLTNAESYTLPQPHAEDFIAIADAALSRLTRSTTLDPAERTRLNNELSIMRQRAALLDVRDNERLETGLEFINIIAEERRGIIERNLRDAATDVLDPFFAYSPAALRAEEARRLAAAQISPLMEIPDPFAPLPGEFRTPFLPPPPPPPQPGQPGFIGGNPAFFGADPTMFEDEFLF